MKGGKSTKLRAICDSQVCPLNLVVTLDQVSDYIGARARPLATIAAYARKPIEAVDCGGDPMRTFFTALVTVVLTIGGLYMGGGLSDGASEIVGSAITTVSDAVTEIIASAEQSPPVEPGSGPPAEGGDTGTTR